MEYVVPLLAVLVIGVLVWGVVRWLGRSAGTAADGGGRAGGRGGVGPERAREAAGLLDEEAHRAVYGFIATNRTVEAVSAYRRHTGRSLTEAVLDVQSLASHPQVHTVASEADVIGAEQAGMDQAGAAAEGQNGAENGTASEGTATARGLEAEAADEPDVEAPGSSRAVSAGPEPSDDQVLVPDTVPDDLVVPADWTAEPAAADQHFEVEFMRPEGSVRLSSTDLPAWLRDQVSAMLRDGELESAAVQLSSHSELTVPEAFELLRRLHDEQR